MHKGPFSHGWSADYPISHSIVRCKIDERSFGQALRRVRRVWIEPRTKYHVTVIWTRFRSNSWAFLNQLWVFRSCGDAWAECLAKPQRSSFTATDGKKRAPKLPRQSAGYKQRSHQSPTSSQGLARLHLGRPLNSKRTFTNVLAEEAMKLTFSSMPQQSQEYSLAWFFISFRTEELSLLNLDALSVPFY